jgi:6,7-dimethyl-8-ribityllumazine synthase
MSNYKTQVQDLSWIDKNAKIVFVTSEFNRDFTASLEDQSEEYLNKNWFKNVEKFLVPGAYEIPAFLKLVIEKLNPDLVICFWVVIRGETTHYEMVAWESARWIMNVTLKYPETSIINWILTCENEEQVKARVWHWYAVSWLNLLVEKKKI